MTEKSFRSQFKATPIKQLKKHVEDDNTLIGASNNEYLTLEDGKTTKIRMFPPHPGMEDFYVAKKSSIPGCGRFFSNIKMLLVKLRQKRRRHGTRYG